MRAERKGHAIERRPRTRAMSFAAGPFGAAPAGVAELVDAPDLGSGDESRGGSTPSARTNTALSRKIIGKVATAGDL